MQIWIKEYKNTLTLNSFLIFVKPTVICMALSSYDQIDINDTLITSKEDTIPELMCNIVYYEDFIEEVTKSICSHLKVHYDYHYLKNAINSASYDQNTDTIITGSSYGLFGTDENLLTTEKAMALPSQDMYYSYKCIKEVLSHNNNIKNIVLICGYYYFSSDLSKGKNPNEMLRIRSVYYPIFKDMHNSTFITPDTSSPLLESDILCLDRLLDVLSNEQYNAHYYNDSNTRFANNARVWSNKSLHWYEVPNEEKIFGGKHRANQHNKCIKYKVTYLQNIEIFKELSLVCKERDINLIVAVPPTTKEYRDYFTEEHKINFYNALEQSECILHLLDLSDCPEFDDYDFTDPDHLDDSGATKFTEAILNLKASL